MSQPEKAKGPFGRTGLAAWMEASPSVLFRGFGALAGRLGRRRFGRGFDRQIDPFENGPLRGVALPLVQPDDPGSFMKPASCMFHPGGEIELPPAELTSDVDAEGELTPQQVKRIRRRIATILTRARALWAQYQRMRARPKG